MCGIFALFHPANCPNKFTLEKAIALSKRQSHRGPDYCGYWQCPTSGTILCHERLAIMDLGCHQPIEGSKNSHQVIHNGEIYNFEHLRDNELSSYKFKTHCDSGCHQPIEGMHHTHKVISSGEIYNFKHLRNNEKSSYNFKTHCDSESIIYLYEKLHGEPDFESKLCNMLDGVFAFAVVFENEFMVARDPIGVKQMYYGKDESGRYFFSNEMKAFEDVVTELEVFPPGHFFTPEKGFVQYYTPNWFNYELATQPANLTMLRDALIGATHKRLMSDAPIGVLLSGGLDSSLISAIATREMKKIGYNMKSFSIGTDANAPDLVAARKVAKFLGTDHYEFYFTIEEGFALVEKLVWHLETYDITTIRASTPMYFLSKKIAEFGIKVVLSGEGADEIFGGYLYFHNAPNDEEFQKETIRRVRLLSTADCLRADKSCMANHLEVRVPFLDKSVLKVAMEMAPEHKRPKVGEDGRKIEKWLLRKAFDDKENPYIPSEILWRQKEQFSDGVGYGWIDSLVNFCNSQVTDEEMAKAPLKFPINTPETKEAYYIRKCFHKHFPSDSAAATVHPWIPKWQTNKDPSGRASNIHDKTKETGSENAKLIIPNGKAASELKNGKVHNKEKDQNGNVFDIVY